MRRQAGFPSAHFRRRTQTPTQAVARESRRILDSEQLAEAVSSLYLQGDGRLLAGRLQVLTGVRFERTEVVGVGSLSDSGAVYQRDAAGNLLRSAAGAPLRRPEAGAVGSMEELRLTLRERAARAARGYEGFYPSQHANLSLRENLLFRRAFAQTYGRPNFSHILPRATISQADLAVEGGQDDVPVQRRSSGRNVSPCGERCVGRRTDADFARFPGLRWRNPLERMPPDMVCRTAGKNRRPGITESPGCGV